MAPDPCQPADGWRALVLAGLVALAVASAGFLHIAVVQPAGLDPPPETAALFVVATALPAGSYLLVRDGHRLGYVAAVASGLWVVVVLGLVLTGAYGPAGDRTNPVGPVVYALLAAGVAVAAVQGWRRRPGGTGASGNPTRG